MSVNERWRILHALIHQAFIPIFPLFIIILAIQIEVLLPIDRGEVNLKEEVIHVRLKTIWVRDIGSTLVNQSFLLDRDDIAHIDTDFKFFELFAVAVFLVFFALLRVKEYAGLADLKLTFDFAMFCAIVHV